MRIGSGDFIDRRVKPDDLFEVDPETEKTQLEDALDSFGSETSPPSFIRLLNRLRGAVPVLPSSSGASLARSIRERLVQNQKLIVGAASVALVLLALVVVWRMLGGSQTAGERASEAVEPVTSNDASATDRLPPRQATAKANEGRRTPAGERQLRLPNGNGNQIPIATSTTAGPTVRDAAQSQAFPTETAPTPEPAPTNDGTAVSPDRIVYSREDLDVRPPQMLSPELPRPAVASWPTRTNSMELIVSESGSVERVRLVRPPQRMPDMMLLSRAKVWKFQPAVKDGRPVRYRVVLSWEVNP